MPAIDESVTYEAQKVQTFAHMDYDIAAPELQESILEAREEIIMDHPGWVADGYEGRVINVETGETVRELPEFHEVFPEDWEVPVEAVVTDSAETFDPTENSTRAVDLRGYEFLFSKGVYLDNPKTGVNTTSFGYFNLAKEHNFGMAYASLLTASKTCNIGLADANTGASLGYASRIRRNEAVLTKRSYTDLWTNCRVAVRASTYDTPGHSTLRVYRSKNGYVEVR